MMAGSRRDDVAGAGALGDLVLRGIVLTVSNTE